ncbi:hypothetical protein BDV96DRAFT_592223 [Lophiotrema nucula]|uniref:DUF1254 domain-containing protein n=1 Tax=Lophiotrema nucula TaxID=690887 RepID=A0A6A5YGW5_9PLEO|nr:hypothetical protein BDV96DRAFT_592223 [Lophiotrema nucula]
MPFPLAMNFIFISTRTFIRRIQSFILHNLPFYVLLFQPNSSSLSSRVYVAHSDMKLSSYTLLGLTSIATSHPTLSAHPPLPYQGGDACCSSLECKQNALAFAFTYGFPLYSSSLLAASVPAEAPTNLLLHQRTLLSTRDHAVNRPNADTLYSTVFWDLSNVDLEITVPDFDGRFGVWPWYDLYGNNFANIGDVTNFTSGKYLVRYDQKHVGVGTGDSCGSNYTGCISSPTPYGINIIRVVTDNTTSDLAIVHAIQDKMSINAIPRKHPSGIPSFDLGIYKAHSMAVGNGTTLPESVLHLTAALASYNLPGVATDRDWVNKTLTNAGIKDGIWTQPAGTNLTAAVASANASVEAFLKAPGNVHTLSNDWTIHDPSTVGDFHSNYIARFYVATWAYVILTSDQAVYPSYDSISSVAADKAILLTFSGRPLLKKEGFWSLTAYGADEYFIPNDQGRYTLGDRSNLTFPDGSLVYSNSGEDNEDGPFQLLLQPADVKPPANWTSNWLPAPSGGGDLQFTLRWYGAEAAMSEVEGYKYPKVEVIDAIKA